MTLKVHDFIRIDRQIPGARAPSPALLETQMPQSKMPPSYRRQRRRVRARTPALPALSRPFHLSIKISAVFVLLCFLCQAMGLASEPASIIPAFPGAEGFGANTPGGRGGRVIAVTNLSDDGPGSFRAACEAEG